MAYIAVSFLLIKTLKKMENTTKNGVAPYTQDQFKTVQKRMGEMGMPSQKVMREISFALQLINSNKDLQACSKESLQSAVINVANIGLTLNPAAKEAYLIARWNSQKRCKEAGLEPSYIGLQKLIMEHGGITSVVTNVVYENDQFELDLADKVKPVTHKPCLVKSKRGALIGAYSVATLPNGDQQPEWIDIESLHEIRALSESYKAYMADKINSCVWISHESEMCRKTVIKRLVKYLPRTSENDKLTEAIQTDNEDYGATFQQANYIQDLLMSANVTPEKERQIWDSLNSGMSFSEAKSVIEFLQENQIDDIRSNGGAKIRNQKEFDKQIANAVNNPKS